MKMITQKIVALFARYCATHLFAVGQPSPCLDDSANTVGHFDRIFIKGQRVIIEGWADSAQITIGHNGQMQDFGINLQRPDVVAAFPDLTQAAPGFVAEVQFGGGPVSVTILRGARHFVYQIPMPTRGRVLRARARLILPFLRDLILALPTILHWYATKDPADRTRFKRHLRLTTPSPGRAMQSLLFIEDSIFAFPVAQQAAELARLNPAALSRLPVTLIMPVFNAADVLPEALDRVLRHTDLPWRLILIDDASTDPAVRPFLQGWIADHSLAHPNRITLIENDQNQGFIRSVNAALKRAIDYGDHVILLNSDAFVPKAWASRLMRPFLLHDRVATVTPMSNDAEIFSTPVICARIPLGVGQSDAIDSVAAKIHPDAALADAPTGVGFCMAMSIDYLRKIPQLDTSFGRGYGEEVDWCQKARALGGRNLGAANLFVEHRGGTSFGSDEKRLLVARNNAVISQRYPSYDADVQRFIAADPLAASRLALAIAWAASKTSDAIPLYLAHNLGGGAEDYLTQRIAQNLPNPALVLRVGSVFRWQLELHSAQGISRGGTDDFNLIKRLLSPVDQLRLVYSCGVGDLDPVSLPDRLLELLRGPKDRIEMLLHDYLPISPSYTLLSTDGRYLGVPECTSPDAAHSTRGRNGDKIPLATWQKCWGQLIEKADDIVVFSQNSAQIFLAAYPSARPKVQLLPHTKLVDLPRVPRRARALAPVIGVLGNIGFQKGAGVLQQLAQRLDFAGGAKLIVLGQVDPNYPLAAPAVVHGGYRRCEIPALVARYGITDWLIPSIWPETFSYTTHEAIATGLPVWGFDLGAQADAIRSHNIGCVIPIPGGVADIEALLTGLLHPHHRSESAAA